MYERPVDVKRTPSEQNVSAERLRILCMIRTSAFQIQFAKPDGIKVDTEKFNILKASADKSCSNNPVPILSKSIIYKIQQYSVSLSFISATGVSMSLPLEEASPAPSHRVNQGISRIWIGASGQEATKWISLAIAYVSR